jgi:hypothetical protein
MQEAIYAMKLHQSIGVIALGAIATVALMVPLAAQQGRYGQVHIVKDCGMEVTTTPGSDFCTIVISNLTELPAGTRIYYGLNDAPTAGPGYFDQNIFVFVNASQWAVGRCTGPNDIAGVGQALCTISDGVGPLAGFNARLNVTSRPGGTGALFGWDGTYSFNPLPPR